MTLTFTEETHEYRIDGNLVPSVSDIISPLTEKQFSTIPPDVLRVAAERGADVHAACEAIDYGLEPDITYPDIIGYITAYEQFLYDHDVEWYGIEEMGACTDWGEDYAGTVDRWGIMDGENVIVDIKTVAQPSIEQKCAVCMQTFLYDGIIAQKHDIPPTHQYALYLKKNGDYTLFDCDAFEKKEGIHVYEVAQNLFALRQREREAREFIEEIKLRHRRKKDE